MRRVRMAVSEIANLKLQGAFDVSRVVMFMFSLLRGRLGKGGRAAAHASLAGGLALTQLSAERSALAAFGAASVAWRLQRVTSTSSASSGDLGF
jgi:hypothetical protein